MRTLFLTIATLITLGSGQALAAPCDDPYQAQHQVQRSDKVQIQWGASWYAGTILEQRGQSYLVRYDGYSSMWDEWVGPDRLQFAREAQRTQRTQFQQVAVYEPVYQPTYQHTYQPTYRPQVHKPWKKDRRDHPRHQRQWR